MIPIMSWRNIWRNPARSIIVMLAIALGVWAAMFMTGFATGMVRSYVNNTIANIVSHIQIHHPDYAKDNEVKFVIPSSDSIYAAIARQPAVKAASVRTLINGMISAAKGARGIRVKAVEPEAEASTSALQEQVVEGEYLDAEKRNPILISKELAGKLGLKLRSKVVLTFQDAQGEILAAAFRVAGIFETGNDPFDEAHVFIVRRDANRLLAHTDETDDLNIDLGHEIALLLHDPAQVDAVTAQLRKAFPTLKTETYRQVSPDLDLYESQIKTLSSIYLTVIMLALIFGIVNTMLMAVLERVRELGMLMAIGMNKVRVFFMVMLETILLCLVAAPLGLLLGYGTIVYLGKYGINLSAYSETMQMYGMSEIVYFEVEPTVYLQAPIAVAITAVVASIYPAWKAIRLKPVEAIRKI